MQILGDIWIWKLVVHGLIISHIDYCNSLFYGLASCKIHKLQHVQNMAVKLVLGREKLDSSTVCLKELHGCMEHYVSILWY